VRQKTHPQRSRSFFLAISDPVEDGLVASLARPGGNVTGLGVITRELTPKRFELLSEMVPETRANPVALHVLFRDRSIAALTDLPVQDFSATLQALKLAGRERDIARDLLAELAARTSFLCDVGLGYFAIESRGSDPLRRRGPAHSPGGAARSNLQGVCYVLDEPTIGLHPARQCRAFEHPGPPARQGQYTGRGRTR